MAVVAPAIPIVDAVGDVAVLLYLHDGQAAADGVFKLWIAVPLLTPIACFVPQYAASFFSNRSSTCPYSGRVRIW